jgi:hypothetical protein
MEKIMRIWFFVVVITLGATLLVIAFEAAEIKKANCPATHRVCV